LKISEAKSYFESRSPEFKHLYTLEGILEEEKKQLNKNGNAFKTT
jgi:hypothetical protein